MSWLDCSDCHVGSHKRDIDSINQVLLGTNIENGARNYSISRNVGDNKILSRKKLLTSIHNH